MDPEKDDSRFTSKGAPRRRKTDWDEHSKRLLLLFLRKATVVMAVIILVVLDLKDIGIHVPSLCQGVIK